MYVCVPNDQGGQETALDSLEVELKTVVSHNVGPGN